MNLNLVSYGIFLTVVVSAITWLGKALHSSGYWFIWYLTNHNTGLSHRINNLLLYGYYLINLGYAFTILSQWEKIDTLTELLVHLYQKTGGLLVMIALMHYLNMIVLKFFHSSLQKNIT